MKYVPIIILATLILSSCSNNDEPTPEVFSQVTEITNGTSDSKSILYDDYGRVIKYVATYPDETINSTYIYVGDNLIKIHTEHIIYGFLNGDNAINQYDDELIFGKGSSQILRWHIQYKSVRTRHCISEEVSPRFHIHN